MNLGVRPGGRDRDPAINENPAVALRSAEVSAEDQQAPAAVHRLRRE